MPFTRLLSRLVHDVEGAEGAILMDTDGEAIQWFSKHNTERLRLRAAYLAVILGTCKGVAGRTSLGSNLTLFIDYEHAKFVAAEVTGDYFLVLELSMAANVGEAFYRMNAAVAELRSEFAA